MYNHFCETIHNKKTRYKKSKLIIIFSLLGLMAPSMHGVAGKLPFDERKPVEDKVRCEGFMYFADEWDMEPLKYDYITGGCYAGLRKLLASKGVKKSYNHHAKADPHRALDRFSASDMGILLQMTGNTVKDNYTAAYWDIFDLLFDYTDIKELEPFDNLIKYHSMADTKFAPGEFQYLAGRFLSREDTVRKLMKSSQTKKAIHTLELLKFPQLNLLMPFGLPLTLLDMYQLGSSINYDKLTDEQQQELATGSPMLRDNLVSAGEAFDKSIQKNLAGKLFIEQHKEAHSYLINALSKSAREKRTAEKGDIRVLNALNAETPPCKKAKTNSLVVRTVSPLVVYGVITTDMLKTALELGLNPNTLISGIDFDPNMVKRIMIMKMDTFLSLPTSSSLLEWAAMGNIQGAPAEDTVTMLIKAGANPHALPEEGKWSEIKQAWLKKLQSKVDALNLPGEGVKHDLHELMLFDPQAPEAKFMRSLQEHLNEEVLNGSEMLMRLH